MKKYLLCLVAIAFGLLSVQAGKTKVVAHRGYWTAPGSAQNSIRSLIKADSIGCDASEFDVYMTSDGVLVLNHDGVINGYPVSSTSSKIICKQKLENGENLPTLKDFLKVAQKLKIDLVFEIKGHATPEREREVARACVDMINKMGLAERTQYISFSKVICEELAKITDRPVSFLWGQKWTPAEAKAAGCAGCDYSYPVWWDECPDYFQQCVDLGMITNIWTVDSELGMRKAIDKGFDYLTTNYPEMAQKLIAKKYSAKNLKYRNLPKPTKVVAHRGYWNAPGSAQNSIRSLIKADSIGADGSEFDVWMCSDGVVVLNHDGVINGLDVQQNPSSVICAQKLANGENVPTLDQFLNVAQHLDIDLVLEVKWHATPEREDSCIMKCLDLLKKYNLLDRTIFISFSPNACKTIGANTARPNQFLGGTMTPKQIKELGCSGADLNYWVYEKNPGYVPELKERAMEVNVWTVNKEEEIQKVIDYKADYITTDAPELAQKIVAAKYPCCKKGKECKKNK